MDRKRLDALAMLAAMQEPGAADAPMLPSFHFEWTFLWDQFIARSADATARFVAIGAAYSRRAADRRADAYGRVETQALLRMVAGEGAARPAEPSRDEARAMLTKLRDRLSLYSRADLDRWMSANALDPHSMERLIEGEARLEALRRRFGRSIEPALLDELRLGGDYARLAERASKKDAVVAKHRAGGAGARTALMGMSLRLWYFEKRLGLPVPDDFNRYVSRIGFEDASSFDDAIYREWLYLNETHEFVLTIITK